MSCEIEIIRKEQLRISKWSGGTTIQLAIYPKNADYSERNFKWRVSTAKVELEESTFTSLPNINRILMILEGKLILEHVGHYRKSLAPFEQDQFSGNWITKGFGKVTDFNVMMTEDCVGEVEAIQIKEDQSKIISLENKEGFAQSILALYCVNGDAKIDSSFHDVILNKGDFIIITWNDTIHNQYFKVYNEGEIRADLIRTSINY